MSFYDAWLISVFIVLVVAFLIGVIKVLYEEGVLKPVVVCFVGSLVLALLIRGCAPDWGKKGGGKRVEVEEVER